MIPFDTKNYRASGTQPDLVAAAIVFTCIVLLIAALAWISNIEREVRLQQVRESAAAQCGNSR